MSMSFPRKRTVEVETADLERLLQLVGRGEEHCGYDENGHPIWAIRPLGPDDDRMVRRVARENGLAT
jgi:hypothetical protein